MIINRNQKIFFNVIEWSLLAAVFFVPIYFAFFQENYTVFDLNKSVWLRLCLMIAVTAWLLFFCLSSKLIIFKSKKIILAWGVFFLAVVISTIFSLHPMISLLGTYERQQGLNNIAAYLILFIFIITIFRSKSQLKRLIVTLNISAAVTCLYGLTQCLGFDFLYWSESSFSRIFSTFGQPNFFGHYLVVMIPLTIYSIFFISRRFYIRILFFILLLSEFICLLFTSSRGAWIALLGTSFIALVFCLWHFKKRFISLALVVLSAVFVIVLFTPSVRSNLVSRIDFSNNFFVRAISILDFNNGSVNIRLKYWSASWQAIEQAPFYRQLFGFGPDVEASVFARMYQPDWAYAERLNSFPDRAHNNFFDILLQFGFVGLLSLLTLIYLCIERMYKVLAREKGEVYWLTLAIGASLLAYFFNNLFSFSLTAMSMLFYVLLALSWRVNSTSEQIDYKSVDFFHASSRWLISGVGIIFMTTIFYGYNIRPLVADYYYFQVKKGEAEKDCWKIVNNIESVMEWYPASHYYSRAYLHHNVNCLSAISSEEAKNKLINNIIDQTKNIPPKEIQLYTLIDLSHAYSILGYYSDPKYYGIAEKYYQEMLLINPNITTTYQDYGRMKLWQAKYKEARKIFLDGITASPSLEKAVSGSGHTTVIAEQLGYFYHLIGLTYSGEKNFDQAIINYKKALGIYPETVSAYKELADIAYQQKNIKLAIEYNKKGFAIDFNNSLWPFGLASLYLELGDKTTALRYANEVKNIDPNNEKINGLMEKLK
ncbi:MAG: O-antigen ligase family protein [Candidatus Falkowbacteria bacterium]|nr:O-antigen ligase family protein [Candidatus Falkowbacteria bacterium]